MLTLFTGSVAGEGEIRIWADGAERARAPVSEGEFSVALAGHAFRHVCVEHVLDGQVRRAQIVPGDRDVVEVPPFSRGSTLRAIAWRQAVQSGLADPSLLVDALLPDRVSDLLGTLSRETRLREQKKLLRCLRVALHAQAFGGHWVSLDPELAADLSSPIRIFTVIGAWRSAMRVAGVDRRLVDACESVAATMQLRASQLATSVLERPLAAHGIHLPDPRAGAWNLSMLVTLRRQCKVDFLVPADICQEVATAMDRSLDGIVAEALRRDDPTLVTETLRKHLESLESTLQRDLEGEVHTIPGGWVPVAALWVSNLAGLGFNADIDRATEIHGFR
ncbi:MAG: hypothetical protein H6737_22935 [Alphaproteobacteria bacterium]|nr:hypothetical protein [Alphaproteobacteria bacterium]